jgi:GT2 family glycosyltransferase
VFAENFNQNILAKFAMDKQLSMASPLILRFDKKTIDSAGQSYSLALFPRELGYNRPISSILIQERPVFSVCGAAVVVRREALEKLKIEGEFYDNDYFIFWEDFDAGWRAKLLGMKVIFYPQAVVYHYRSGTLKKNILSRFSLSIARSPEIKYHLIKNRYLTLIKNYRFCQYWWAIPFILFKDIAWVSLLTLSAPKIIIKLMGLPKYFRRACRKRKIIQTKYKLK